MATTGQSSLGLQTFLDSGATHHYFVNKKWFTEYVEITPMSGQAANSSFDIVGTGTVALQSLVKGKLKPVLLRDVMHAPSLHANLISVPRADYCGLSIAGKNGELELHNNKGETILVGSRRQSTLYKVQIEPLDTGRFPSCPTALISIDPHQRAFSTSKALLELWHR
jgi:hypothetical protein